MSSNSKSLKEIAENISFWKNQKKKANLFLDEYQGAIRISDGPHKGYSDYYQFDEQSKFQRFGSNAETLEQFKKEVISLNAKTSEQIERELVLKRLSSNIKECDRVIKENEYFSLKSCEQNQKIKKAVEAIKENESLESTINRLLEVLAQTEDIPPNVMAHDPISKALGFGGKKLTLEICNKFYQNHSSNNLKWVVESMELYSK